jgi:hypothetical protein
MAPPCASARVRFSLGQRLAVGSPCGSPNVVTRDASDRLLPSQFFVRAPAPRRLPDGSRVIHTRLSEGSPGSRQCDSLRWAARTPLVGASTALGVVFPVVVRAIFRTSGTPVASSGIRVMLAHHSTPRRSPRPPCHARVKRDAQLNDPRCLPSYKDLRPATPFRAPGSGHCRCNGLATAAPVLDAFSPARHPRGCPGGPGPRSRVPLPTVDALILGTRRRLPTSATCHDTRAHPSSDRSSHASGAFAPLLAGTNRCRLRWSLDTSPHRGPASHGPHATACAAVFHLRGRVEPRVEAPE